MSFRAVVIKDRSKLDLRLNYMVIRGKEEKMIHISEISVLILESTAISLTCSLISKLMKENVKVIFCDEKHNPESELICYNGNYHSVVKINEQIRWTEHSKGEVWQAIIREKISNQRRLLEEYNYTTESKLLGEYLKELEHNDTTNREGHSAKVYFNAIFGTKFDRRSENEINGMLNYGYSVMLAIFNREIVKSGYLTQLGIWHKNEFNYFNLSCDIFEPFRVIVDRIVLKIIENKVETYKYQILQMMNLKLKINGKEQYLENAVAVYCQSVFDSLREQDTNLLKFYELQSDAINNIFRPADYNQSGQE